MERDGKTQSGQEIQLAPGRASPEMESGSIFFIGNATVLIRYAGFTVLTDPTYIHIHGEVPIGYGMHSKRLTNPAIDIADLPPVDLILLSHFHGDHFDQVVEAELDRALPVVTTSEAGEELEKRGFRNTYPLETWSSVTVSKGESARRSRTFKRKCGRQGWRSVSIT